MPKHTHWIASWALGYTDSQAHPGASAEPSPYTFAKLIPARSPPMDYKWHGSHRQFFKPALFPRLHNRLASAVLYFNQINCVKELPLQSQITKSALKRWSSDCFLLLTAIPTAPVICRPFRRPLEGGKHRLPSPSPSRSVDPGSAPHHKHMQPLFL